MRRVTSTLVAIIAALAMLAGFDPAARSDEQAQLLKVREILSQSLLLVRYGQRIVFGIDDEDSQQARKILVTRILTDRVMRARHLVEAFADVVDFSRLIVNLAANGT